MLRVNVRSVQLQKQLGAVLRVMQRVADGSRLSRMHVNADRLTVLESFMFIDRCLGVRGIEICFLCCRNALWWRL